MALIDRNIRSSTNYVWNTSLVLGKGATSSVYQGLNRHTGEAVAVKAFNPKSLLRPYEVQRREYEVLGKLKHENIVKLLAIEEEAESHHQVLIMELCTGGSLFTILDDPANSFGLEESEFLLVSGHLAAGMKYLRDMNIIHRDLKPGNIMKFTTEDGQTIYKLTDFGAARELEEDQQFVSLYGTEEYLHPELYAKAVLKRPSTKSFTAKVDLWSLGVTLFHTATGSLPFRPFGGLRNNQEMMHRITTEKKSGIISGIQSSHNGDIEWSSELPNTCLLSPSLQYKITPLLAGLLEYNPKNMWTFDQYFQSVTHISSHKAVHVFCVNSISDHTIYMQSNEKICHLKARLAGKDSAQIPMNNQLLIWNKRELLDDEPIIFTAKEAPIIVLNSKATSIRALNFTSSNQFKFPEILNAVVTNSGDHDAQQGKACASIAYCIRRSANKCLLYSNIIGQIPEQVLSLIERNARLLNEQRESCSHLIESLKDQIEYTSETTCNLTKCATKVDPNWSSKANSEINDIRATFLEKVEKTWNDLLPKIIESAKRVDALAEIWKKEPKIQQSRLVASKTRADFYCARIKESWLVLHKNKSSRSYAGNEVKWNQLEKLRIDSNCKKLKKLLHEEAYRAINELVEKLDDWYSDAHVTLVQSKCLYDELTRLMKTRDRIVEQLNTAIESQHHQWKQLLSHLNRLAGLDGSNKLKSQDDNSNRSVVIEKPKPADSNQNLIVDGGKNTSSNRQLHNLIPRLCYAHNQEDLADELEKFHETQRLLCASLSENQNLFSELVSLTISAKNVTDSSQY